MGKVALIKEGQKQFVDLPDDSDDQLAFMHQVLHCDTLEVVMIAPDLVLWVDEEGIFKEPNHLSLVAYAENNNIVFYNELSGNIVITSVDRSGATIALNDNQMERVNYGFRVISTQFPD